MKGISEICVTVAFLGVLALIGYLCSAFGNLEPLFWIGGGGTALIMLGLLVSYLNSR